MGLAKKEYLTKLVGLEHHTFDIGNATNVVKYQKAVDTIPNHIQKEYRGGPEIAKAIRDLSLPTIAIPEYPKPDAALGATQVIPGDIPVAAGCHHIKELNRAACQEQEAPVRPCPQVMHAGT